MCYGGTACSDAFVNTAFSVVASLLSGYKISEKDTDFERWRICQCFIISGECRRDTWELTMTLSSSFHIDVQES